MKCPHNNFTGISWVFVLQNMEWPRGKIRSKAMQYGHIQVLIVPSLGNLLSPVRFLLEKNDFTAVYMQGLSY